MQIAQLKFNCIECNYEASPTLKEPTSEDAKTYTVKCSNEECELSKPIVQPSIVNPSLAFGTLEDNLRAYFIVETLW